MFRKPTKADKKKATKDTSQLALQAMISFISYFDNIAKLNGDGMIRVSGKQASVPELEALLANPDVKLLSEKDNKTPLNVDDLYDANKNNELYPNAFLSSDPSASIRCRTKPDIITNNYGISADGLNYRQLILLNNVFFEAGMDLVTHHGIDHGSLKELFSEALKGVDFSKMGMAKSGENQPDPAFLAMLRARHEELSLQIASSKETPEIPAKAKSAPGAVESRKFGNALQGFFKRGKKSAQKESSLNDEQKELQSIRDEINSLSEVIGNANTTEADRKNAALRKKDLQAEYIAKSHEAIRSQTTSPDTSPRKK